MEMEKPHNARKSGVRKINGNPEPCDPDGGGPPTALRTKTIN
jgi:hypothetical protein